VHRLLSKLWWLPGVLATLTSAVYFVAADTGDLPRFGSKGALWLALAVCMFWVLSPRRGATS
jgi:hypothetical protein